MNSNGRLLAAWLDKRGERDQTRSNAITYHVICDLAKSFAGHQMRLKLPTPHRSVPELLNCQEYQ